MVPRHDEILKTDRGMTVAWDTTDVDQKALREVLEVVRKQAAELGQIVDIVVELPDGDKLLLDAKAPRRSHRGRTARRRSPA
jgi:hypothetical protein